MAAAPVRTEREPTPRLPASSLAPADPGRAGRLLHRLDHPLAGSLRTAGDLARAHRRTPVREGLPLGSPELARLLPEGLPRGELVELVGERSSGRLSAVLALLAAVTGRGDGAVLVDVGDGLAPRLAAAAGVDLPRLLWARCSTLREGLAAVEIALGGGWPLVILELGERPIPGGRGTEACWQRLAHAIRERESALLVASPCRVSGAAAGLVLHGERAAARWLGRSDRPGPLAAARGEWQLEKGRGALQPGARASLSRRDPEAFGAPDGPVAPRAAGERNRDGELAPPVEARRQPVACAS